MDRRAHAWLATLIALLAAPVPSGAEEIPWRTDYAAARREALEKNRPIVMDLSTENCFWCKKLDAVTFRDPAVVQLLRERFVAMKIDASQQAALAQALGVQSYPTLVFAAPDGKILGKHAGFVDPQRFMQQLQKALTESAAAPPGSELARQTRTQVLRLAAQAKDDPEQLRQACEDLGEILATLHLELAETLVRAGQQRQATACLQKVVQNWPGSQPAQTAQLRLQELDANRPRAAVAGN